MPEVSIYLTSVFMGAGPYLQVDGGIASFPRGLELLIKPKVSILSFPSFPNHLSLRNPIDPVPRLLAGDPFI